MFAISITGCKPNVVENGTKKELKAIKTAVVSTEDIVRTITLSGTVKPVEDTIISAEIAGSIIAKPVNLGDLVTKNSVLAKIDEESYKKVYEQAEAILKVAQANLEQNKATQDQLQKDKETNERLFEQNVISKKILDDIATKLAEVNALVKLSEAKVKEAEIALDIARINRDKATVKCPLEKAFVADISFDIGNYVVPGKPLVRLVNIDKVWIEVGVGEKRIKELERNIIKLRNENKEKKAYVDFTIPSIGEKKYTGSIEEISPNADPATKSFTLRILYENSLYEIKSGMFALVNLPLNTREQRIVIPKSAVIMEGRTNYVYVIKENTAEKREVKTGITQNEKIEIIEGIQVNEIIAVDGADMLKDGDKVKMIHSDDNA